MEPAKIDWKNIQSIFVEDELYEYINAPKYVDFSAPDNSADDEAWFCKPDCHHPKTAEDFLASTLNSKVKNDKSAITSEILPLGDRNCRDANLKRRLAISSAMPSYKEEKPKFQEDGENENPNFHSLPPLATNYQRKQMKATIKCGSEKKKPLNNSSQEDHQPQLKGALSARNLGKEIFNDITEMFNELKKLTLGVEEKENSEEPFPEASEMEKEEEKKKSLVEAAEQQKSRKKSKNEEIRMELKKTVQRGEESLLLQVRTSPPSPQCFSAPRRPLRALRTATVLNPPTPSERGLHQEVEHNNMVATKEAGEKGNCRKVSIADTEAARSLDLFWFLKPCTFLAK